MTLAETIYNTVQKLPASSYPRKRVFSCSAIAWITAFAGMTKIYSELV